jgi:hypothetical protein
MADRRRVVDVLALVAMVGAMVGSWSAGAVGAAGPGSAEVAGGSGGKVSAEHAAEMAAGLKLFNEKVGAILRESCLECHGGDKVKANFNLATREHLLHGGDGGQMVVAGDAAGSEMMALIRHEREPHMPSKKPKLSEEAIALIGKWIDLGAPYGQALAEVAAGPGAGAKGPMQITEKDRKFWSFLPLGEVAVPKVADGGWGRTKIDAFVAAKLAERGLRGNGVADRRTLIRRAYMDALGVVPTPEEVDAFVADDRADAWERLVDRVLADRRFGERWAPHWLDVARFAESDGFEHDYFRKHAYHYRDFVIRAINDDLPYDTFVKWQLAGDEYEPSNPLALMATGFLTAGVFPTQITEREFETTRYDQLDDMVSTTTVAFLGLTVGCARCHDHKFDAITARDYYELSASFTRAIRNEVDLDLSAIDLSEERQQEIAEAAQRLAAAKQGVETARAAAGKRFPAYLQQLRSAQSPEATWQLLTFDQVATEHGTVYAVQSDGSLLKAGKAAANEKVELTSGKIEGPIHAVRLEVMTDPSLPQNGPGAADNGNFALTDLRITAQAADGSSPAVELKIGQMVATHQQNATSLSLASSFDDKRDTGWAVDFGGIGKPQAAVLGLGERIEHAPGTVLRITMRFDHPNARHIIGRMRWSVTQQGGAAGALAGGLVAGAESDVVPKEVAAALTKARAGQKLDKKQTEAVRRWWVERETEVVEAKAALARVEGERKVKLTKVQITSEGLPPVKNHADDRGYPHFYDTVHLLARGDVNSKVEPVKQGFLEVLTPVGVEASQWQTAPPAGWRTTYQRRALAEWMVDTDKGAGALAARVMVNRIWQHHMGRGIVATPNDFGTMGDAPIHPELLEYLAHDFATSGWRMKRLHRAIMTSAVYMQSSEEDSQRLAADPQNVLLWRFAPRRMEAEAIRDSMLSVSGLLDGTMMGPGTLDEASRRRSVYFSVKRAELVTFMLLFDWPERLVSIGARPNTTISPQALLLMNSPHVRSWAAALADRFAREYAQSPSQGVNRAYRLTLGRVATEQEIAQARAFIDRQTDSYVQSNDGKSRGIDEARRLALTDFAQAMLSLNEFVYIP